MFVRLYLLLLPLLLISCTGTIPLHTAKTLPIDSRSISFKAGLSYTDRDIVARDIQYKEIGDSGEYVIPENEYRDYNVGPELPSLGFTLRVTPLDWVELGVGIGMFDLHSYLRIPLTKYSAGTATGKLVDGQYSRWGASLFGLGTLGAMGMNSGEAHMSASTGVHCSYDIIPLDFESYDKKSFVVTSGLELWYRKKYVVEYISLNDNVFNSFDQAMYDIAIPLGVSLNYLDWSIAFEARGFIPLHMDYSETLYSENPDDVKIHRYGGEVVVALRWSRNFNNLTTTGLIEAIRNSFKK